MRIGSRGIFRKQAMCQQFVMNSTDSVWPRHSCLCWFCFSHSFQPGPFCNDLVTPPLFDLYLRCATFPKERLSMNRFPLSLALVVLLAVPAFSQFEAGSVLGTIRDANNAVVRGAKITLTNNETGIAATATSDDNGNYEFPTVKVGLYKVTAEQPGFSTAVANDIRVNVSSRQRVDLQLAVGQVSQTVELLGAPRLVETDTSQRDQVISHEAATELPLNGRQYSSLVLLTSGVKVSPIGTGSS